MTRPDQPKLTSRRVRRYRKYYEAKKQRSWNENRNGGNAVSIYELADRAGVAYSTMYYALKRETWKEE